jgi:hypothetical protein
MDFSGVASRTDYVRNGGLYDSNCMAYVRLTGVYSIIEVLFIWVIIRP